MLASVNYIRFETEAPLHLDKEIECDGILVKGNVDTATTESLGVVRVINGNGLTIVDGAISMSLASDTGAGAISAEEKKKLQFLYDTVLGIVPRGTARINGVIDTPDENSTFDYETVATDWEGILWICNLKMFVAYKTVTTPVCGCSSSSTVDVKFTYYTHWKDDYLYMQSPGEYEGLWKDKIYIGLGLTWQWASCDEQLVYSGADLWREATSEELQDAVKDFIFVDPPTIEGITGIEVTQNDPLTSEVSIDDNGAAHIKLGIAEATEEEIDKIFK